jgi:hypothetical protein
MDPSIPPSDGRCLFFKLPAELRNEIYEYALTADDGLVCRSQDNKHFTYHALRDGGVEDTEFNQIHYVCRQLHTETKGLVLYLNNNVIIFKCDVAMTSVEDDFILLDTTNGLTCAEHFLQQCAPTLHPHLERLTVCASDTLFYPNSGRYVKDITEVIADNAILLQFCRANPQVTILVRFSGAMEDGVRHHYHFNLHYMLARNIRSNHTLHILQYFEDFRADWSDETWMNFPELKGIHLPLNLRIAMTGDFQKTMDAVLAQERETSGASDEVILAAARKLFEEGI